MRFGEEGENLPVRAQGQAAGGANPPPAAAGEGTPPTGKRQALRDLRRELTPEELASTGVQKMLLEELARADEECDERREYERLFHLADKRAAVLQEGTKTSKSLDAAFGVMVGLGGAIIGLAPFFWDKPPAGPICLTVGILLVIGGVAVQAVRR